MKNRTMFQQNKQRGDVSIYIALMLTMVMLSSSIVLASIVSKQIKLSRNILSSERAFYAASAAFEASMYGISRQYENSVTLEEGSIEYQDSDTATYEGGASVYDDEGGVCVRVIGRYRGEKRRLALGPADCEVQTDD